MSTHHPEFHQCLPIQGFEHIYLTTKNNSNHNSRVRQWLHEWPRHSSLQNRRFMSQARRTRYFARSARRGEEKKKGPVASPLFWLFPRSLYEPCVPIGWLMTRCSGMFVWNKISLTHSCSFDDAVREAFCLFPSVPEIKENHKKCLNCPTEP